MKKARTLSDIKNDPRVYDVHREHDGAFGENDNPRGNLWVYLEPEYRQIETGIGTIHEPTVSEVCWILNNDVEEKEPA